MTTPKKKKPVDLSKCKIGQPLKMRCGDVVLFGGASTNASFPFTLQHRPWTYRRNGAFDWPNENARDIVEILPLPKRKKAPSPKPAESDVETLTSLFAQIAFSNDAAWVKRAVKALQFIKKP